MEKGNIYVFYNDAYLFSKKEDDLKIMVGEYLGEDENKVMSFKIDNNNTIRYSKNVHDELNPEDNVNNFIEYLAKKFQDKFQRNVSVWQEDYEFKIQFAHNDDRVLDDIEDAMNEALEDWWSVLWHELKYNSIQVKRDDVLISFRVHDVHEVQFRYNDK